MDYQIPVKNRFSQASLVCGILAIITILTGVLPIFFGSLSIIFGILSKKSNIPYDTNAKVGFGCGTAGMLMSVAFMAMTFILLPTMFKDEVFRQQLDTTYKQIYGVDFEEFIETYTGQEVDIDELFGGDLLEWQ